MTESTRLLADPAALTDAASRAVVADALLEEGRPVEAGLLRGEAAVELTAAGKLVLASVAEAARARKCEPRPGFALTCTRRDERPKVGTRVRRKDGVYVVTEASPVRYVSDDDIEDMDAWAEYPQGPGRYCHYTIVPVEETAAERKGREAKEVADRQAADAAGAKARAEADAWAPVADLPDVYQLPAGLEVADDAWRLVSDDTASSKFGHGTRRWLATLPDGSLVGKWAWSAYDDDRSGYKVPQAVIDQFADRTAEARRLELLSRCHEYSRYRDSEGLTAGQVVAEWDALAAAHHAAYGDLPGGLSPAMRAREAECLACHPADWPEAVRALVERHPDAAGLRRDYAVLGLAADLEEYRAWVAGEGAAIAAARQAAYDEAYALWMTGPEALAVEFGEEAAAEIAAGVLRDWREYSHVTDADERFGEAAESARKDAAAREAKEEAKAARKADPLVTVTGNTYPHRDALGRIPGSKLSKLKGGWTWKVPRSQAGKLPRGLSWE